MSKAVIAAGYVSDEAIEFLQEKGAYIDSALGISMIELPEDAVQWTDEDGNDPSEWIKVYLNFDASKTEVNLHRNG